MTVATQKQTKRATLPKVRKRPRWTKRQLQIINLLKKREEETGIVPARVSHAELDEIHDTLAQVAIGLCSQGVLRWDIDDKGRVYFFLE